TPTSLLPRWNGRRPTAPGSRARLSLMTEVGAPLKASISSGAGFGTLVMAVVMLTRTVPPGGDGMRGTPVRFGRHMMVSITAKQLAFRLSRYNGFRWVGRPVPGPRRAGPIEIEPQATRLNMVLTKPVEADVRDSRR